MHGRLILLLMVSGVGFLTGCDETSPIEICYSKFSSLEKPEFKGGFTKPMSELADRLRSPFYAYSYGRLDLFSIAENGNLYIASTCDYAYWLRPTIPKSIAMTAISKDEYEEIVEIVSQPVRFFYLERH